jgi:CRISPR-associated protein Cas1
MNELTVRINGVETRLGFQTYLVRLRHRRAAQRRFFHARFVNSLLVGVLGHPLPNIYADPPPPWIAIPYPIESGKTKYQENDPYNVVITLAGNGFPDEPKLRTLFENSLAGAQDEYDNGANLVLSDLCTITDLKLVEQVRALSQYKSLSLYFTTPLDIEQVIPGQESLHFDPEYFDAAHFFKTLYFRVFNVSRIIKGVKGKPENPEFPIIRSVQNRLQWLRSPMVDHGPDQPAYYGAVGRVILDGDFVGWEEYLVLGQYLHVGKRLNFGFGRYIIEELKDFQPDDISPEKSIGINLDFNKNAPPFAEAHYTGETTTQKQPVYIDSPEIHVKVLDAAILVADHEDPDRFAEVPFDKLSHIVVSGGTRMTLPAFLKAAEHGVPAFFIQEDGSLYASLDPRPPGWEIWQAQSDFCSNQELILEFSRRVVSAKLHNQAETLRGRREVNLEDKIIAIRALEKSCADETSLDSLRKVEQYAAGIFFDAFRSLLGPQWKFKKRIKHPPTDPVNAMLSFGYTTLYGHCSTALQMERLNPQMGIFHEPTTRYYSLAADLQEEFRYLVDSLVLRVIRKGQIHPEDFVHPERQEICLMLGPARKKFMAEFEERLKSECRLPDSDDRMSYRRAILRQAEKMKNLVLKYDSDYIPMRIH